MASFSPDGRAFVVASGCGVGVVASGCGVSIAVVPSRVAAILRDVILKLEDALLFLDPGPNP